MSAPSNHWKLGAFVVAGFTLMGATFIFLGARSLQKETVTYFTYFDESVQGLDVGSPVKFLGVPIGSVSDIGIAPDQRHVSVSCDIIVSQLESLKLLDTSPKKRPLLGKKPIATLAVPPDLRTQLGSAGITGVKYIAIDYFDIKDNPAPVLPFPVPENYIPAAPSTLKNIEDAVVKAVNRFPEIADELAATMGRTNRLLGEVEEQKLPQQVGATLAHTNEVMMMLEGSLKQADLGKISKEADTTLTSLRDAIVHLDGLITKMDGDKGILASAQRATDSIGDLAGGARGLGSELADTLREVREAADSLQRVTDALDTDSDMLLKGRAKGRP